jgi:hypothetical protein
MTPLRQRFYARRSFIAGQSLGIVAAIYAASTVVMVTPFVDLQTLDAATFAGDGRLNVWTIAWVSHAIVNGLTLFDANMYFPTPDALAYTEHMSTLGLLAVPVQAFTDNPVLIFAVLWLASFWTNAMAAHILALRLTGRHDAALIAGLIFGWSYFRILHLAHLQLQWTAWMPLGLVLLERWYRSPSAMNLLQATVVSLAQILTSWYLAVISVLLNTLWVCWLVASKGRCCLACCSSRSPVRWELWSFGPSFRPTWKYSSPAPSNNFTGGARTWQHTSCRRGTRLLVHYLSIQR